MDPIAKQSTKDSLHGDSAGSDGGSINSCPTEVTSSSSSGIRTNDPANLLTEQKPRTRIKFSALDLPDEELGEFKKSRKRMQNRVSAMKCREKQKTYTTTLEGKNQKLADENGKLSLENASLKAENGLLRRQIAFFESMMSNFPMMRKREPQQFGDMESMGYPAMKASGGFNDGWAPTNADDGNGDYKAYMSSGSGFGNSSFMFVVAFICIYMVVSAFDDSSAINPDWTNSNRHLSFNDSTATSAPTNGSFGSNLMMSLVGTALLGGLFVGYKTYKSYSKSS